jgi:pimeloyl-ACP methyl ester carboxylesterase
MPDLTTHPDQPTVVLVHGAFADGSSWNGVLERLMAAGIPAIAPPNPLRGIATDSAYLASVLRQTPGDVVLVGHSYGGAVISNAASQAKNVVGLVYVAAFAPDQGERLGEIAATSTDSTLMAALVPRTYPGADGDDHAVEFIVDPDRFHATFAADLPADEAAILAATQRGVAEAGFSEPNGEAAWKRLPAWAVVATGDKAAGADVVRANAQRAGAAITEIAGSHVIMVSQPAAVTDVILAAVAAVRREAPRTMAAVG